MLNSLCPRILKICKSILCLRLCLSFCLCASLLQRWHAKPLRKILCSNVCCVVVFFYYAELWYRHLDCSQRPGHHHHGDGQWRYCDPPPPPVLKALRCSSHPVVRSRFVHKKKLFTKRQIWFNYGFQTAQAYLQWIHVSGFCLFLEIWSSVSRNTVYSE